MNRQIPENIADKIYDILVEHAGASPRDSERSGFIYHQGKKPDKYNNTGGCAEYRFQGKLGFGGKFWNCNSRFYVNAYTEDTGSRESEIIQKVNELLKPLYEDYLKLKK